MKLEFIDNVTADGVTYTIGQIVDDSTIALGTLESLRWTRRVRNYRPEPKSEPGNTPTKPAAKKSQDSGPARATAAA